MNQNVDVLYPGWPNFSYFTTVIVISFEADYLLNPLTYRNMGVTLVHNFFFSSNSYYWQKLIWPLDMEIENTRIADKSILIKIILGCNKLLNSIDADMKSHNFSSRGGLRPWGFMSRKLIQMPNSPTMAHRVCLLSQASTKQISIELSLFAVIVIW
jgi:hypothetical protein